MDFELRPKSPVPFYRMPSPANKYIFTQVFLLFILPGLGAFLDRIGVRLYARKAAE